MNDAGIFLDDFFYSYDSLNSQADLYFEKIDSENEIVLVQPDALDVLLALTVLNTRTHKVHLFPYRDRSKLPTELQKSLVFNSGEFRVLVLETGERADLKTSPKNSFQNVETEWVLYTSGTTGEPKPVSQTMYSLTRHRTGKSQNAATQIWGLTYEPYRMGGLQVLLNSLLSNTTLIATSASITSNEKLGIFSKFDVNAISGTPSMFREFLRSPAFVSLKLDQITLGGEIADQAILNLLIKKFPAARITHIYASSELSQCFSVSDGLAGFPTSFLNNQELNIDFSIEDDELVATYQDGDGIIHKHFTGDLVQIEMERVYFKGRKNNVINVGGLKVQPEEIESVLLTLPSISGALVYPVKSSQLGQLLAAKIVLAEPENLDTIRRQLRTRFPKHKVPFKIEIVDSISIEKSGKVKRQL